MCCCKFGKCVVGKANTLDTYATFFEMLVDSQSLDNQRFHNQLSIFLLIDQQDIGLVNGAQGFIKQILFNQDSDPQQNLPAVVFVEFEGYTGKFTPRNLSYKL